MKIAILGNMNNNGFALMRYLRDLGVEADLILFLDDGVGNSSHFSIESDTWNLKKWEKYIYEVNIVNSYAFPLEKIFLIKYFFILIYLLRRLFGASNSLSLRPNKKSDKKFFLDLINKYDVLFGSGATPAILDSIGKNLTIFMAYSNGIEYIDEEFFLLKRKSLNPVTRFIANKVYKIQSSGLKKTDILINTEFTSTKNAYEKLNLKPLVCQPPIVYFEESNKEEFSEHLTTALDKISKYRFKIISHARHQWVKPKNFTKKQWARTSKNNQILIYGFKDFLDSLNYKNSILILFEYGVDYKKTKELCIKLGIDSNVIWLPKMQRKEILELIKNSSVGIGEFYENGIIWGGTGWEILGSGIPLMQKFSKKNSDVFKEKFNFPPPPILVSDTKESVTNHLKKLYQNQNLISDIGKKSKKWFKDYNSYSSSRQLISLLEENNKD